MAVKKFLQNGAGGGIDATFQQVDGSDLSGAAWAPYTPVVSSETGAITTYTASGRYQQIGKIVFLAVDVMITANGTGASAVNITLPVAANITINQALNGAENGTTGKSIHGVIGASSGHGSLDMFVRNYDNTYPANSGSELILSGTYEAA